MVQNEIPVHNDIAIHLDNVFAPCFSNRHVPDPGEPESFIGMPHVFNGNGKTSLVFSDYRAVSSVEPSSAMMISSGNLFEFGRFAKHAANASGQLYVEIIREVVGYIG
jgi:hypothetical protein